MKVVPQIEYSPAKAFNEYRVIGEGRDHYRLSVGGKVVAVPFWVFKPTKRRRVEEEEEYDFYEDYGDQY